MSIPQTVSNNGTTYRVTAIGTMAFRECTNLTGVTIPSSVTSIGEGAFYKCTSLPRVTIPNSVTSIGINAFLSCNNLTSVDISNSLTSIPANAFASTSLTSVTIPNSVTTIDQGAFNQCYSLTSVVIGSGVTSIGYNVFGNNTTITYIECKGNTPPTIDSSTFTSSHYSNATLKVPRNFENTYRSAEYWSNFTDIASYDIERNGIYYLITSEENKTVEVTYKNNSYNSYSGSVTIPSTVEYNNKTYSVTRIGTSAFRDCTGLTSVTIPSSVTTIDDYAFQGCSNLTSLDLPPYLEIIDEYVFMYCTSLTSIEIPNTVTSIGRYSFYGCTSLTDAIIGNGVTEISYSVFRNCSALQRVTIFSGAHIFPNVFTGCDALTEITCWATTPPYIYISTFESSHYSNAQLYVPVGKKSAYQSANIWSNFTNMHELAANFVVNGIFYKITSTSPREVEVCYRNGDGNCYSGSVTIPSTVTYGGSTYRVTRIGDEAFYNCAGLTSVTIPSSVTSIGSYAFSSCTGLTSVTIPSSVTYLGESAFGLCTGLTSVTVPASVTDMGAAPFAGCDGLTTLKVASGNPVYSSPNNCNAIIRTSDHALINGCKTTLIPYNVTAIETGAFYSLPSLTSIEIPSSVTSIGRFAFAQCTGLTSVTFPSSVIGIGDRAFQGCTGLTSVKLPSSLTAIGVDAFQGCILMSVTCLAQTPPDLANEAVFDLGTYANATLNVPSASVSAYQDAFGWSNFAHVTVYTGPVGYACYTPSNTTLTFYYDDLRSTREGTTYDLNTGTTQPKWYSIRASVTDVVFDPSFAGARPTTAYYWFREMSNLTTITGIENLNTSDVTRMNHLFYYCSGLTSVDLSHFNTSNVTNMDQMFNGCTGLTSLNLSSFNTSNVKDMSRMFYGCTGLTSLDLSSFNTSNVTNMNYMFYNCTGLTSLDLSSFNTSNVTNMNYMFYNCTGLTSLDLSSFNTSNVTNMYYMFYNCTGLTSLDVTHFNTSNVTNMNYMFYNCTGLTSLDVSHFNTSNVTSMQFMFSRCSGLSSLNLSSFNTSNVTSMANMFNQCENLTSLDLSSFNTSKVTSMYNMFFRCYALTSLDLSGFNTSSVTNMSDMFNQCLNLTSVNVSSFNTSNVTNMRNMFGYCHKLTSLDLSSFNTSNVTDMSTMFRQSEVLTTIYVGDGWSTDAVTTSTNMFTGCTSLVGGMGTTYDANHVDKTYAHIDGGPNNPGYFTAEGAEPWHEPEAYACYTPSNTTLTFYYDNQRSTREGTTYDLYTDVRCPDWVSGGTNASVTKVVFNSTFADARPTSTFCWFYDMANLTNITGISYLKTNEVTNMGSMFYGCNALTSLDLSSFNTANVTDMSYMFTVCNALTSLDLSNFNTANVTNMNSMFYYCNSLTSLDLSNFNTTNVTDMNWMFNGCIALTSLDLRSFNTANVTKMINMFYGCYSLTSIYVGNEWSTVAVTRSSDMFLGCTSLVGGQGTTYDANHVDATYAHIDGGSNNPGYFTAEGAEPWHEPEAYACYTPSNTTLTFYYDNQRSTRTGTIFEIFLDGDGMGMLPSWVLGASSIEEYVKYVVFDPSFANANPTSTCGWFGRMEYLQSITGMTQYLNTSRVTDMSYMFLNCKQLTNLDLSGFNTAKAKYMLGMFSGIGLTELDLSYFNTARVTITNSMFQNCDNLATIYVGEGWSTASVTNSLNMFDGCTSLVGGKGTTYDANHVNADYAHIDDGPSNPGYFTDINAPAEPEAYAVYTAGNTTLTFYFDTERSTREGTTYDLNVEFDDPGWFIDRSYTSVTHVVFDPSFADARPVSTCSWFWGMTNLQSITGMDCMNTEDVTTMWGMFSSCSSLTTLDLSSFNTSQVTNMLGMFSDCSNLTTIYAGSGWSTATVTTSGDMFKNCTSLVGGMGTTFDPSHTNKAYARIDEGPSRPGYFSEKTTYVPGDVSGDQSVNIADVASLIDLLLMGGEDNPAADCNPDGNVNVSDLTSLIDYLLSGAW